MATQEELLALLSHDKEKNDLEEIKSLKDFVSNGVTESKKLWALAAPAIFTSVTQYSLNAVTQVFAGHLTTLELDAVAVQNLIIAGLAFGIMLGMGCALETLCGQAFGAKQLQMLGVYMQRSWIILTLTSLCLLPIYIFATPILRLLNQDEDIAALAGKFALYMIPQLFAYAFNFPLQKFLQAQSKVMAMAVISAAALVFHILLSWILIIELKMGLVGAAISLNLSWWLVDIGQFVYIVLGYCPGAWNGFTWVAFRDLVPFFKLSVGSAIMLCLEYWFFMFLIIISGSLKNAQVAVAAISICINVWGWDITFFLGFNAAISVRVSNELGAGRPRAAKFSVLVVIMHSFLIGLIIFALVIAFQDAIGLPFTNSSEVANTVSDLAIIFAFSLLLNSVQPVLVGVAIGAGWQWLIAIVNFVCYYGVGIPVGCLLAFYFDLGVKGMWSGMLTGIGLQTLIIIGITVSTNWDKEAMEASARVRKWGGSVVEPSNAIA